MPDRPTKLELLEAVRGFLERELTRRIRAGDADSSPWRESVLEALSAGVRERLAISNPAYR